MIKFKLPRRLKDFDIVMLISSEDLKDNRENG